MSVQLDWPRRLKRFVGHRRWALVLLVFLASEAQAFDLFGFGGSGAPDTVSVTVEEPYIEMHTGAGRGYPVFNVVEQGETVEILKRKTNWYKIKNGDKIGWTTAAQLAHTLRLSGVPVDLPEVSRGDYLKSHWRLGFTGGSLEGASTFSVTAGYRPFNWGAELEIEGGKIFDESVTSDYYGVNLLLEPTTDWLVTPYVSVGGGMLSLNDRQKVVVDDAGSPSYVSFGAGASYYVVSNLVLRGGYRSYSISTDGDRVWLNAWTIGLSLFF